MRPSLKRLIQLCLAMGLALALVAAVACGGGDDDEEEATPTPEATAEATPDEDGELEEETVTIDEAFWHSGWMVELEDASLSIEEGATGEPTYLVTIEARFTNLGEEQAAFGADYALVSNGESTGPSFDSEIPQVGGGLTGEGTLVFEVDEDFAFTDTTLVVGASDEVQAQVPLGPDGEDLIVLEPMEPPVTGTISLELIDLNIQSSELRADVPVTYSEVEEGKLALTLYFSATSRKGGSWSLNPQDFALTLPDGISAPADGAELGSLQGSELGVTTEGLYVRFIADDPADGPYTLRFKPGSWWIEQGPDQGEFSFEIAASEGGSPTP